jgi:hypothetical protein
MSKSFFYFCRMKVKYYTSTNWAPWLGFAFLLSTFFFSAISNGFLMALLILLSFLPAAVVYLTLRGYFVVDNFQIKYCYGYKSGATTSFSIPLSDIKAIENIGKAVAIYTEKGDTYHNRVHDAPAFVEAILKYNPRIEKR